jgi:hypothetical protein
MIQNLNLEVSSAQFWMSSIIIALIDALFVLLLVWRIKPADFRELKWPLVGSAVLVWSILSIVIVLVFWDTYYKHFFPGWFRSGGLLLYVPLLYGVFAYVFLWLSLRIPGHPLVNFCILAGLESLLEHLWGFYGLKILKTPILQDVSPISILAFSFPEYIFYWCIIIGVALLFQNGWRWWIKRKHTNAEMV